MSCVSCQYCTPFNLVLDRLEGIREEAVGVGVVALRIRSEVIGFKDTTSSFSRASLGIGRYIAWVDFLSPEVDKIL